MSKEYCENYCGVACIDGSCPVANGDAYAEYCIPVVGGCKDCHMYKGCEDCMHCDEDGRCFFDKQDAQNKGATLE